MQSGESDEDMHEERSTTGTQDGEPSDIDHEAQETVVYQDRIGKEEAEGRDIKTSLHV